MRVSADWRSTTGAVVWTFRVDAETGTDTLAAAILTAESGAAMAGAARQAVQRGFAGLEWAVSLPGTVGGAVVGNAGAYGSEIKDSLLDVRLISETEASRQNR